MSIGVKYVWSYMARLIRESMRVKKMSEIATIIGNETVQRYITVEEVIQTVEDVWTAYGNGRVIMPPKVTTDMSPAGVDGWFNSMPSYIQDTDTAGIKVVGGYNGNKAIGLPFIKANILLTDSHNGKLKALVAGDWISDMRTGAQPAIMAEKLAAKTDIVTIIGAGLQGYTSLLCMSKRLKMKEVRVCDLNPDARKSFIAKFADADFEMVEYENNQAACEGSDIIITVTTANADLVKDAWVKKGALVMTMGSFRETAFDVIRNADCLAVDHPAQALHRGNFKELGETGELTLESFDIEIPLVLAGKQQGRRNAEDKICAEIVGMGCPDVAIADLVYKKVMASGEALTQVDMTK